jgi:putative aldouronate transport system permease protein
MATELKAARITPKRRREKTGFFWELRKNWVLFLMLAPTLLFFAINNYIPMVGIYWAFTKFSYGGLFAGKFVWFDNFRYLFSHSLLTITVNTVLYNVAFIVIGNIAQIFVAILLHEMVGRFFKKFAQTIMFFPYFVSYVIMSVIVYNLFNFERGLVNNVLVSLGLAKVNLYAMPGVWPFFIVLFYLWKWVGYGTVIYLATILGISREYYEAAQIDGANIFQQIRHITLPNIKPTFIILLLFALGGIMRGQFEMFYQIVGFNGTLFPTTDIIDTYVYRALINTPDIPMVTAAGLFQSFFGFVLVMIINFLVKRRNPEYALF